MMGERTARAFDHAVALADAAATALRAAMRSLRAFRLPKNLFQRQQFVEAWFLGTRHGIGRAWQHTIRT
jgi:hypothetical protein